MIAITQRVDLQREERRDGLDQRWTQWLRDLGQIPLLLPNDQEAARELVERCSPSGFLLTGGGDLAVHDGHSPERDQVENWLIEEALRAGTPLVGVCRGMQALQRYFGVALERIPDHVAVQHQVQLFDSPNESPTVNSYHDWGSDQSTRELEVWARAEDGIVEGVRHPSAPLLGLMWHPERTEPFARHDQQRLNQHWQLASPLTQGPA